MGGWAGGQAGGAGGWASKRLGEAALCQSHLPASESILFPRPPLLSQMCCRYPPCAGIVTSTMTGLLGQSRLFVVLGRERLLPARLATVSERTGTPAQATLLTGCLAAALALVLDIGILAELVSIGTWVVAAVGRKQQGFAALHTPKHPSSCPAFLLL